MKIKLDIDTTPEELRTFFGLPDIKPLQEEMLNKIREQMEKGIEGYDPLSMMKPFMPENMSGLESLQQQMWKSFTTPSPEKSEK